MNTLKARLAVLIPLLIYFALAIRSNLAMSLTVDEGLHIASGYTILRTGDYRLVEEHPPLLKLWMALPLLPLQDLPEPTELPAWKEAAQPTTESFPLLHMAQQLLYPYHPIDRWLFPARAMQTLLGVLLLAGIMRWAKDLWGVRSALFVTLFAALDPNLLAHGAVAGTDAGAAALILLGLLTAQRFLRRPTLRRATLTGIMLGLALTAKLTALLLGPALGVAGLVRVWQAKPAERTRILQLGFWVVGVTALTFWGVYDFQIGVVPGIAIPLPAAAHAIPMLRLFEHAAGGHTAFLLGETNTHGWWWYFPVAFALKTPLPTLLLALWALVSYAVRFRGCKSNMLALPLFTLLYSASSLLNTLNIGYRHLLPLLPLLYIWIGFPIREQKYGVRSKQRAWQMAHGKSRITNHPLLLTSYFLLLAWQLLSLLRVYPHTLTFFNELIGGAHNGWRYLADSNTDWGQAYKALGHFQQEENVGPVRLSAFIFYDPALYGIAYTPLTPLGGDTPAIFPARFAPPPGDYVISTTPLNGIPLADPEMYDWFRWRAPDAQIANALHYYHVTPAEVTVAWIAQCNTPVAPLDDAAIAEGFGDAAIRRVDFDCTQSWLIPGSNAPGRYILHGAQLQDMLRARLHLHAPDAKDSFVSRRLETLDIVYRQRAYRTEPAFAIYASTAKTSVPSSAGWVARAETSPSSLLAQTPIATPINFEGLLTFLGATAYRQKGILDVETWWLVSGAAPSRPLSVMGHLLTESGEVKGVADGLGLPPYIWQTGDIIVQRHVFPLTANETHTNYVLRTGVYWLDDGTRWSVKTAVEADAVFIPLTVKQDALK